MKTSTQKRRQLKQRTCAILSLIGSGAAASFYMAFAYLHDMNAEPMVQACMLAVTGVSVILSISSIIVGVES